MMNKEYLIMGAGRTILDKKDEILGFIQDKKPIVIGVNNMTSVVVPDFHLWTNRKRFTKFHGCIKSSSKLLFGCNMPASLIKKHYKGDYKFIKYKDASGLPLIINDNTIAGTFRTAGTLAIAIAHSWKAKQIYVVGMDGYTLHDKKKLKFKDGHQHCYGKGFTDDADWNKCVKKDKTVQSVLKQLNKYGVNFQIITPTKFSKFYNPDVLKEYMR